MRAIGFRARAGILPVTLLGATLPALLAAQTQIQFGAFYSCPGGTRFKVFSCAGNEPGSACEVQTFNGSQSLSRGPAPHAQVIAFVQNCHLQTGAEEKAAASRVPAQAGAPQTSNGINVGDSVEVVTGFGWTPAKVVAVQGDNYRVNVNGIQVTKTFPAEVRRVGGATAPDHAAGQYRLGDRVQVNVNGQWMDGKIVIENGLEYQVQFGNRTVWAGPPNLRPAPSSSSAPSSASSSSAASSAASSAGSAPAAAGRTGGPPRPGMTSCAGKIEGRYATTGLGSATIAFRSGKAIMGNGFGADETLDCWTSGDKIILREPGHPENDMPIDINNDGTLEVPVFGEFKKKGN
jgi:hypothetical protein